MTFYKPHIIPLFFCFFRRVGEGLFAFSASADMADRRERYDTAPRAVISSYSRATALPNVSKEKEKETTVAEKDLDLIRVVIVLAKPGID